MSRPADAALHAAPPMARGAIAALLCLGLAAAAFALFAPGARKASAGIDRCAAPESLTDFRAPLPNTAQRLARGGDLGAETEARIARDVLPEKPDLVIWQIGTNDVLNDLDPAGPMEAMRSGIAQIERAGADVILMDMQYAPAVLAHERFHEMEHALWITARAEGVPLFRRFALMREWAENRQMSMATMLGPDRLHMTDASYDCLARQLSASILRETRLRTADASEKG